MIHLADGREIVIDGLSTAPASTTPDSYTPVSDSWPDYMETADWANRVGPKAIAVPGNLKAWCKVSERFGARGGRTQRCETAVGFMKNVRLASDCRDASFRL
ncbi:hypothetical protein BH11PSE4_BH11PSE4_31920 [soil metagenome]